MWHHYQKQYPRKVLVPIKQSGKCSLANFTYVARQYIENDIKIYMNYTKHISLLTVMLT